MPLSSVIKASLLPLTNETSQERNVIEVAKDVAKIFNLPESKITYVKDRAFNDQYVTVLSLFPVASFDTGDP